MALTLENIQAGTSLVCQLSSFPVFCAYLLMIVFAGKWKRISKPLNIRPVLVVYNFTASAISLYTLCGFIYCLANAKSSFDKTPSTTLTSIYRIYWLTKLFELSDTVFMVLRHKQRQISFLHVYHHSSMVILSDLSYHFYPYPAIASYLGLNSAVHVILYLYYGLAALTPDNPPEWKKFLTQFQIIQFFIDMVHASFGYLYHGYCVYGIFYGLTMIMLFSNFYYKAYIIKRKIPKGHENNIMNSEADIKKSN